MSDTLSFFDKLKMSEMLNNIYDIKIRIMSLFQLFG
jgi:hypothetical protein